MAVNSKALNGSHAYAKYQSLYVEFELVSQDTGAGTSTFRYRAYLKANTSGYSGSTPNGSYNVTGASTASGSSQSWSWNYNTMALVKDWTSFTLSHDGEGNLPTQTIQVYVYVGASLGNATVSVNVTAPNIPRVSVPTLSASSVDYGGEITTYTNRASTAFTHTLKVGFNGIVVTVATGIGASHKWTVPASWMERIPDATSSIGTVILETYYDGKLTGSRTVSLTAKVPSTVVPTVSTATYAEATSGLSAKFGAYIQNKSKLSLAIAGTGACGSTIKSTSITVGGKTYTTATATTTELPTSGTINIVYKVVDSRGRSGTVTKAISVLAYTEPEITSATFWRCTATGADSIDGAYFKVVYTGKVASLGNKNDKNYRIRYKKTSATSWTTVALTNTNYTQSGTKIIAAETGSSYNVELLFGDYFTDARAVDVINSAGTTFDMKAGGLGVAFGKFSETDNLLDSAWAIAEEGQLLVDKYLTRLDYTADDTKVTKTQYESDKTQYESDMALGAMQNLTLHANVSGKYSDLGGNFYRVWGKMVIVNFRVKCDSAVTSLTRLFTATLPTPSDGEYYISVPIMDNQAGKAIGINIDTNGIIQIRYGDVGRSYYGQFIYFKE